MTASIRAVSTGGLGNNTPDPDSYVVAKPVGTTNGDLLVCIEANTATGSGPDGGVGWSNPKPGIYTRTASSEPASYEFDVAGTDAGSAAIIAIQDWGGTPSFGTQNSADASSITGPSVDSVTGNELLLFLGLGFLNASGNIIVTSTPPSGMVEVVEESNAWYDPEVSSGVAFVTAASQDLSASGATGSKVASLSNTITNKGVLMLIPPVSGGGGGGSSGNKVRMII